MTNDEVKWRNIHMPANDHLTSLLNSFHIRWQILPDGSVAFLSSLTRLDYILDKYEERSE